MTAADSLLPAPGRGQYDRRLPRSRRQATQRARLLSATAVVLATEPAPTVAAVIRVAGVGRNTFYEYFDHFEHARDALFGELERWLVEALRAAEESVRTPVEAFRSLSARWFTLSTEERRSGSRSRVLRRRTRARCRSPVSCSPPRWSAR
jgi:AcrR family transcriptional regulator